MPAQIYRYIVNFLATNPTPQQIAAFSPTTEMQERLQSLQARERSGELTSGERVELEDYEQIEHLVLLLKAGSLP